MLRRGGGGGEFQSRSWKCWEQVFNSIASAPTRTQRITRITSARSRKESKEAEDAALLLLQRSKEQEEQEEEEHLRWEEGGGGETGILKTVKSTVIMTRKGEIWKNWVLRLGTENRCTSAPYILYPLPKPLSSLVQGSFSIQNFPWFSVGFVTQPFTSFVNFCCVNYSRQRRGNPFEVFQYQI